VTTSRTRLCCLIGDPVDHSLSPQMFSAAFSSLGLDYAYLAFRVRREDLGVALEGLRATGFAGCNVTVPHKISVIRHLDRLDPHAELAGSVNVVANRGGELVGYSTDGEAALISLEANGVSIDGRRVLIVGYGGAARAVAFEIALKRKPERLLITGRDPAKASELAAELGRLTGAPASAAALDAVARGGEGGGREVEVKIEMEEKEAGEERAGAGAGTGTGTGTGVGAGAADADIIINATPSGMHPLVGECPLPAGALREGAAVLDLVYNPAETRLLRLAKERGCTAIDGLEMLVQQGARGFSIWTGIAAPVGVMREAVRGGRGR